MKKNRGITLIALVITIIVLLILAGISIATLTGENSIFDQAGNAKALTNIAGIKEEIDLYKTGEYLSGKEGVEAYPIAKQEDRKLTIQDMLSAEELNHLPQELKFQMLTMSSGDTGTEIPNIENLDYSQFYKLDTELIKSAKDYKDRLVIFVNGDTYKVIHVDGVMYEKNKINIIIPLNNEEDPQFITTANNTYKFYGDGTVKVIGNKNGISGITSEEYNSIYGIQELNLEEINQQFGNKMALPEKKLYISCGTAYVIDQNDDLWAWGDNSYNKLGQGNSYLMTEPTKILEGRTEGAEGIKAKNVWAGATNTFVIDTENRVWICGANHSGSLGQGNTNIYSNFVSVSSLDGSQIEEVALSLGSQTSNIFVVYTNGNVYIAGNNGWGQLGIENTTNQLTFINISDYNSNITNVKQIKAFGVSNFLLKENGELYGCGYNDSGNLGISGTTGNIKVWTKITENVEQMEYMYDANRLIFKDLNGSIYSIFNKQINKITNIPASTENKISSAGIVISNSKMYLIRNTSAEVYGEQFTNVDTLDCEFMRGFTSNGKKYLYNFSNITKPKKASIYSLKSIFNDAIYVQSSLSKINIVNKQGEIYENLVKNNELNNVKKLITSSSSNYCITENNRLYAKGNDFTGMWGDRIKKDKYLEITIDGTNPIENVKNLYTSKLGYSSVFTTFDNKLYWAGSTAFIILPGIQGDSNITGMGSLTKYAKEVTSPTIDKIKNRIKDIKYSFINGGGVTGRSSYILTENGELYTISNNKNMSGNEKITRDIEQLIIREGTTVQQIETADGFSMAVLSNGEIYGWGYNTYGILGDGYDVGGIYPTPVKMNLPSNIKSVSLGSGFAIFASKSGEIYGIGKNDYGQLGTGDNKGANTFVRCTELEK